MARQLAPDTTALEFPTNRWEQMGIAKYLDELTPKQRESFRASFANTTHLSDILSLLKQERDKRNSQKRAAFMRKLEALSQPLQQFSSALDVIAQTQAIASLVWGPLKAVIVVGQSYSTILHVALNLFSA